MKINWGYTIFIIYSVFIVGILFMVYRSSIEKKDLVSEDYYAEELKYQEIIDQSANTASLSNVIEAEVKEDEIQLTFPSEFNESIYKGTWKLYCAADRSKDVSGNCNIAGAKSTISYNATVKGLFQLQLTWIKDGKKYYFEKNMTL
jgi:hypothetical protein